MRYRPSRWIALVLCGALLTGLSACATTRSPGVQLSDAAITTKVKAKLASDPEVNPFEIDVDTREGTVTLRGQVEEASDRAEAERLARATKGVKGVVNQIRIGDPTTGEVVDDGWIATKIKAKLTADPQINPFNIDVDVQEGVVTLSGKVKHGEARSEAERLARSVKGVRSVRNEIEVAAG